MEKNLLYLEDNGYISKKTETYLEEDGYKVQACMRIDQAKKLIKELGPHNISCIITDLNMEDEWLEEFRGESYGGLMSGWVWLIHFVYNNIEFQNIPSIIYSGYIPDLQMYLCKRKESNLLNKYNISLVKKGGNNHDGYKELSIVLKKKLNEGEAK